MRYVSCFQLVGEAWLVERFVLGGEGYGVVLWFSFLFFFLGSAATGVGSIVCTVHNMYTQVDDEESMGRYGMAVRLHQVTASKASFLRTRMCPL